MESVLCIVNIGVFHADLQRSAWTFNVRGAARRHGVIIWEWVTVSYYDNSKFT